MEVSSVFMDSSCRRWREEGRTTKTALTVYFYQGISRLGTQTNKVIKLWWLRAADLWSARPRGKIQCDIVGFTLLLLPGHHRSLTSLVLLMIWRAQRCNLLRNSLQAAAGQRLYCIVLTHCHMLLSVLETFEGSACFCCNVKVHLLTRFKPFETAFRLICLRRFCFQIILACV